MSIAHFLIVGTNYHPEPKRELKAAQKDAQKIGEIFKDFSQQHTVISLIGEEATKKAIESVIDDLSKTSDPSDILIIYWAGHVERKKNHNWLITNNIKSVNKAETFGFVLENHLLSIDGFAQRISDLEKYKNKVFIFDTCYSESIESILSIDCISESITILAASRTDLF
ncbi:MAG: caspase family protein [Cyanobacteria bacterium J06631_2]